MTNLILLLQSIKVFHCTTKKGVVAHMAYRHSCMFNLRQVCIFHKEGAKGGFFSAHPVVNLTNSHSRSALVQPYVSNIMINL